MLFKHRGWPWWEAVTMTYMWKSYNKIGNPEDYNWGPSEQELYWMKRGYNEYGRPAPPPVEDFYGIPVLILL
jgi:hypothetical protein